MGRGRSCLWHGASSLVHPSLGSAPDELSDCGQPHELPQPQFPNLSNGDSDIGQGSGSSLSCATSSPLCFCPSLQRSSSFQGFVSAPHHMWSYLGCTPPFTLVNSTSPPLRSLLSPPSSWVGSPLGSPYTLLLKCPYLSGKQKSRMTVKMPSLP